MPKGEKQFTTKSTKVTKLSQGHEDFLCEPENPL